jgi:hypothetical protein
MKIKRTLQILLDFFRSERQVGHTSVAMAGAASVPRCLVVAHTMKYGAELAAQAKEAGADGITVISLPTLDGKLLGWKNTAIAFDNEALVQLFGAALEEIDRQERRVTDSSLNCLTYETLQSIWYRSSMTQDWVKGLDRNRARVYRAGTSRMTRGTALSSATGKSGTKMKSFDSAEVTT